LYRGERGWERSSGEETTSERGGGVDDGSDGSEERERERERRRGAPSARAVATLAPDLASTRGSEVTDRVARIRVRARARARRESRALASARRRRPSASGTCCWSARSIDHRRSRDDSFFPFPHPTQLTHLQEEQIGQRGQGCPGGGEDGSASPRGSNRPPPTCALGCSGRCLCSVARAIVHLLPCTSPSSS
jgi:hypothetical protein